MTQELTWKEIKILEVSFLPDPFSYQLRLGEGFVILVIGIWNSLMVGGATPFGIWDLEFKKKCNT